MQQCEFLGRYNDEVWRGLSADEFGRIPMRLKILPRQSKAWFDHIHAFEHVLGVNPDGRGWPAIFTSRFMEPFVL
jgi:hypothetical protein